ncbi:hypothetical protein C8N46_102145 [Kordia periserrulae]|uniref:Uncharacterized protein n=1 Tax=Kordia periserrulae TaxID=701523 RepID=A0A2T6C351_9FLAO|nr:hypothetical protein [Kordia periserrulae]PTX62745.1 hypothetical protein C8N46_102145 [Kordia periserrulae]
MESTNIQNKVEELMRNSSEVFSAPNTETLSPKESAKIYGRPGKNYRLIVDNDDEDLEAIIYAYNDRKFIIDNYTLAAGDTTKKTFQMGPNGFIQVWNWTSPKFTPNPKVTFSIRGVK